MRYYFAPLEGITDHIFRQLHNEFFPGLDAYYTPFLSPTVHRSLTKKEQHELPEADTLKYRLVPQLLTKNPDDFLWMAQQCAHRGYTEVNLNLGCPSGTVTAKGKGAGMLRQTDELRRFLDSIYNAASVDISVKTRIGYDSCEEFPQLLEIFNGYPIKELTIHPRVRNGFYKDDIDENSFRFATENCHIPLCYNGDLTSTEHIRGICQRFPTVQAVMIGRGLIADPGMLSGNHCTDTIIRFYNMLLDAYIEAFHSERNAMFRLKEHWLYLGRNFIDADKLLKRIRKTTDPVEFRSISHQILTECKRASNY